ncbi:MAG: hypothetical protein NC311_05600 [Muribaculaceae bacterium]|nr:hypothetical protein [Muribaculaceae bacterium]
MDQDHDRLGFYKLRRTYSELFKKTNYLAKGIYLVQNRITEYDIRSSNTSILREAHRLKSSTLDALEALPGKDRKVIVGKMIRKDKSLQKVISKGVTEAKRKLFEANGVQDSEILSIKNDAVFIIGRKLRRTQFGAIEFRPKNTYSLYMNIEGIEFYYSKADNRVDVKGVRDEVVEDPDHQEGMIQFFVTVMRYLVFDRKDSLRKYLIEFSTAYKEKTLPVQYYKEFNAYNIYRTYMNTGEFSFNLTVAGDGDRDDINGVYNYKRFVLPLIQEYI